MTVSLAFSARALQTLAAVSLLVLAGCSARGTLTLVDEPAPGSIEVPLLTVTSRALSEGNYPLNVRSEKLSYHSVDILLPPERNVGEVTWGTPGRVDPALHVTADDFTLLAGEDGFKTTLRNRLRATPAAKGEVMVFVHGYNSNYSEAAARVAQMTHDAQIPAVPVLFSWASQARVLGYVHDRDSILTARDTLRQLLLDVRAAGAQRILLVAHSMGSQLVMETLLLADLAKPGAAASLADSVVLISPDIAPDVFVSQVRQISRMPSPFIVFTSSEDRALRLSVLVAGDSVRLGNPSDDPRLDDTGAVFLDVTQFNDRANNDLGHLTLGTSPALIALVPQLREAALTLGSGASSNPGPLTETLLTVRSVTDTAIAP